MYKEFFSQKCGHTHDVEGTDLADSEMKTLSCTPLMP